MAPPTTHIRLSSLDPMEVADEVLSAVSQHVSALSFVAGGDSVVTLPGGSLRLEVAQLTAWAQHGDQPDFGSRDAIGCMQTVGEALWTRAIDRGSYTTPEIDDIESDPDAPIVVVMLAAHARLALARREAVRTRDLAALASVDERRVRQLIAEGALTSPGRGLVDHDTARRWLGGRGIAVP